MELILENVRSFVGRHEIPIKPLTLLVGENSTGKTTVLACLHAALTFPEFPLNVAWDAAPYRLGTYRTIASRTRRKGGSAPFFGVGITDWPFNGCLVTARYFDRQQRIACEHIKLARGGVELEALPEPGTERGAASQWELALRYDRAISPHTVSVPPLWRHQADALRQLVRVGVASLDSTELDQEDKNRVSNVLEGLLFRHGRGPALSLHPVRSTPLRRYPLERGALGDEMFATLRILQEHASSDFTETTRLGLYEALEQFGRDSGLFTSVGPPKLVTDGGSRAFELQAKLGRRSLDLTDVGYGVSQVLPLLVQVFGQPLSAAVMIQQPEIHLHPKAQAAFGTFVSRLAAKDWPPLLIETHSDYILDRVRIEVANGRIAPERVQILFFDKPGAETKVYPLTLDRMGNIVDAPDCYRQFFLEEGIKLLDRGPK